MNTIQDIIESLKDQGYEIDLIYRNVEQFDDGRQREGIAYYFNQGNENIAVWFTALGLQVNPRKDATPRQNMAIYWESEK